MRPRGRRSNGSALTIVAIGVATIAYGAQGTHANTVRRVKGRTVVSEAAPKAELTVSKDFEFVGSHKVDLYGKAEAEQFLFAKKDRVGGLKSFFLMQFERFLPSNSLTYHYDAMRSVTSWPDLAAVAREDPGSDLAALGLLLAKKRMTMPHATVLVRMFFLPTPDRRTEMMVVYGEVLPKHCNVPVRPSGVDLGKESPALAKVFMGRAQDGLTIRKR